MSVRSTTTAPSPTPLSLWHLLSLDAPTVAVLWTFFPARLARIPVPAATLAAIALAVWTLYAADRLLDTTHSNAPQDFEARHLFHHRHRGPFLVGIAASTLLLAALLPRLAPPAIHLYLTEAALMAGYFFLIHATPPQRPRTLPKEFLVGLFFAAATFIPTVSAAPTLRSTLLPCALLFAALCTLNCLYIYAWEHAATDHPGSAHPNAATRTAIRFLPHITVILIAIALLLLLRPFVPYSIACALGASLLLVLHSVRSRLSRLALRTAADAALLTPILFLPFL